MFSKEKSLFITRQSKFCWKSNLSFFLRLFIVAGVIAT